MVNPGTDTIPDICRLERNSYRIGSSGIRIPGTLLSGNFPGAIKQAEVPNKINKKQIPDIRT